MRHLISTYASISPSDIQEIILVKKRWKINSDVVLKHTHILPQLSYFPEVLKKESFQYFPSALPDISTDLTDLYQGRTSSKDEWPLLLAANTAPSKDVTAVEPGLT